jgi:carbon-monoxide dehydrogenase medium subunit
MIPSAFEYKRANSVDEAIAMLGESSGEGRLLAGGHSLIPLMKFRLSEPTVLIDIGWIAELSGIRENGERITIGATTTHTEIATSDLLLGRLPVLAETAAEIGDPQVRNRGTIAGSLAHADPAADYPAVMVALDAQLTILGSGGARTVGADDFFQDIFTVDLGDDEMITSIELPAMRAAAYAKLHQPASQFAVVGVAAALSMEAGVCQSARVGVTGLASHAQRLPDVEAALTGTTLDAASISSAADRAPDSVVDVNEDLHGSEAYRQQMARVFTRRAVEAALARA